MAADVLMAKIKVTPKMVEAACIALGIYHPRLLQWDMLETFEKREMRKGIRRALKAAMEER